MSKENIKSKPLTVKIISPAGLTFDSMDESKFTCKIDNILATGIIPIEEIKNITNESKFDFQILPDHSPMLAKIRENSMIKLAGSFEKGEVLEFNTIGGGIVSVNFDDNFTIVNFTLKDVEKIEVKK